MDTVVISIGSNSPDREQQIKDGLGWLKNILGNAKISPVYNTHATNGKDPDYLNAVVIAECKEEYQTLNEKLKQYEKICGRTKESKLQGNIPIDMDIVIWHGDIMRENDFRQLYFQIGWKQLNELIS